VYSENHLFLILGDIGGSLEWFEVWMIVDAHGVAHYLRPVGAGADVVPHGDQNVV
jgi:hypothetical protein